MRVAALAAGAALAAALAAPPAAAQVARIEVTRREPFAGGHSFGRSGPYEIVAGRIHLHADPSDPANERVADLPLAPRDGRGKVAYRTEFVLLKPVDAARGNRRLLYDVNNRGNKIALGAFNGRGGNDPRTLEDAGNGFLMREGYAILWSGWSGDVLPGGGRLVIDLPVAREGGREIAGRIYTEIEPSVSQLYRANVVDPGGRNGATETVRSHPLVWAETRAYPPVTLDNRRATLTVRATRSAPAREVPRDRWSFGRWEDGRVVPDSMHLYLEDGFRPGWLYELVYTGKNPRVTGLGFASVRDVVAFFRHEAADADGTPNPLAGAIDLAYGYGGSQSGRFLNHFLFDGFNADTRGRKVFDGLHINVAGSGKGLFNQRFAQNARHGSQHEENLFPSDFFPFATVPQEDPVTGERGDLLARARASGTLPRIIYTQTSTEYWNRAASLLHTDVAGERDLPVDPAARIYLLSGSAHNAMRGGAVEHELNTRVYGPLLRATLVAMDRWVTSGTPPPESRYPRIADGTLVDIARFRAAWPAIPGARVPAAYYAPLRLDPGPRWRTHGIADHVPPRVGPPYRTLVPAVDADGNEVAGVRLPDVAVPLATYTGWNLRAEAWGAPGMLTRWSGSYLPFARTAGERRARGDPRPAILERYPAREAYLARIADAVLALRRERLLLDEDAHAFLEAAAAAKHWGDRP